MSGNIPLEDLSLAAEHLSDTEIVIAMFAAVNGLGMKFPEDVQVRLDKIEKKLQKQLALRRKLEASPETARELVADYPIYASTSGISYEEMIDICVALDLDEEE